MILKIAYEVELQLRHAVLTPNSIEFYADNVKYLEIPLRDDFGAEQAKVYAGLVQLGAPDADFFEHPLRPDCLRRRPASHGRERSANEPGCNR